jgi:hypothetical protein
MGGWAEIKNNTAKDYFLCEMRFINVEVSFAIYFQEL